MAQLVPLVGRGKPEAELTTAERALRQAYADRAVEEFRLALADGFSDLRLILRDEALDPIRSRDDFRVHVLRRLATAMAIAKPVANMTSALGSGTLASVPTV